MNLRRPHRGSRLAIDKENGSTLVEFALVVILFLTVFFGIIDFARALYAYHFVAHAAREGTRYAIVRGADCDPSLADCPGTDSPIGNIATHVAGTAAGIGLDPNSLIVNATFSPANYDTGSQVTNCTINSTTNLFDNPGCMVQVQVQYAFKFIFPLMPTTTCRIGPPVVTANICMTSTSQMVISQ